MKNFELLALSSKTCLKNTKAHKRTRPDPSPYQKKSPSSPSLWCALFFPCLQGLHDFEQKKNISELAKTISKFSSTITIESTTIIFEIKSSLRYFRGIKKLKAGIDFSVKEKLKFLDFNAIFYYGISPTLNCSSLIAKSKKNLFISKMSQIKPALNNISINYLDLDKKQKKILRNIGVEKIRDIWRLPTSGLKKRLGERALLQLKQAIDLEPELIERYSPQENFTSSYNLPYPITNENKVLLVLKKLLDKFCIFLQKRDLSTSGFLIILKNEKTENIKLCIRLRHPSISKNYFITLIKAHLENKQITSPIIKATLNAGNFQRKDHVTSSMLPTHFKDCNRKDARFELNRFLEILTARIGEESIKKPQHIDNHCPEYTALESKIDEKTLKKAPKIPQNLRPIWLLPEPRKLNKCNHQLYDSRKIFLVSGPERIESRWWKKNKTQRDYYIAEEDCGARLWVFQDKIKPGQWFVHGVFS